MTGLSYPGIFLGLTTLFPSYSRSPGMPVPLLDLRAQHARIKNEVTAALMKVVDELTDLAVGYGFDTFLFGGEGENQLARFAEEVVPAVRAQVAAERGGG